MRIAVFWLLSGLGVLLAPLAQADEPVLSPNVLGGAALVWQADPGEAGSGSVFKVEPYLEVEVNGFYGGVLVSAANDSSLDELEAYLGYRNETASGFSYDFRFTRFFYPTLGGNGGGEPTLEPAQPASEPTLEPGQPVGEPAAEPGQQVSELKLELGLPVSDKITLTSESTYDPRAAVGTANIGADYAFNDALTLGAAVGFTDNGRENEWQIGATYKLSEQASLDLTYYKGSDYAGYAELTLTISTEGMGR